MRHIQAYTVFFGVLFSASSHATDTWREVTPGIDHLHRITGGAVPQELHVVRIDLTRETISLQASSGEIGTERAVTTRSFADHIGATVAINGDWRTDDWTQPRGLAIANGVLWNEHYNDPSIGSHWGYFACDAFSNCEAVALEPLGTAWWFTSPAPVLSPYRYFNAVGANGVLLIDNGVRKSGCFDGPDCEGDVCRHPRTAICTTEDKSQLYMMVIDGRRSGASGMRCSDVRDLAEEMGCWDAAMLDGGGSSTMVIEGSVENEPADGFERVVRNHMAIMVAPSVDDRCELTSGRWCEGTEMITCSGGRYITEGDCAFFGASCEEDGDWAYCVDPRCPDGEGSGTSCSSESIIETCKDGNYSEGDCSMFGTICAEDSTGAKCSDPRCEAGPSSSFCVDSTTVGGCSDGVYEETSCGDETTCEASGESAVCMPIDVEPVDSGGDETGAATAADDAGGSTGADDSSDAGEGSGGDELPDTSEPTDTAEPSGDESSGDEAAGEGGGGGTTGEGETEGGETGEGETVAGGSGGEDASDAGDLTAVDTGSASSDDKEGCGCSTPLRPATGVAWCLGLIGLIGIRRRRQA